MAKKEIIEGLDPKADALNLIIDRVELFEGYIQGEKEKRKERWRIYKGQFKTKEDDYRGTPAVPYSTATINTIVPRMVQNDTKFRYIGETEKDDKNSKAISELSNDQMRKDELEITKIDGYTETLVQGTAFYKVPWAKETLVADYDKPVFTILGVKLGKTRTTKEKTIKDQPECEHLVLDDVMFDPYGWEINGKNACEWMAHRKIVSEKYLVKKYGKEILEHLAAAQAKTEDSASKSKDNDALPTDKHKKAHELIEYWEDDRKAVMIDRVYIAEDGPNPFDDKKKPFLMTVDHKVPHQLLGIGEIEFLFGLQNLLNDMFAQASGKQIQSEHNLVFLEKGSGLNKDQFMKRPFGIHTLDDLSKIKFERLDGVDPMTLQIIEMLKTFMEYVSGVSDYSKGTGDSNLNDTATGIQLIQEAANYIFQVKVKLANKMFLSQLGDFLVSRNQQFLNKSWSVRVKDDSGKDVYHEITKKDIEGNFICLIDETAPLNDTIRRSEALQLYRQFKDDPDVDQQELKRDVLEAFGKDVKKLMPGMDEIDLQTQAQVTEEESEAEAEDELMFKGKTVTVSPDDDHEVHIVVHEEAKTQADNDVYPIVDEHIQIHKAYLSPRLAPMIRESALNNMGDPGMEELNNVEGQIAQEEQAAGGIPTGPAGAGSLGETEGAGFEAPTDGGVL